MRHPVRCAVWVGPALVSHVLVGCYIVATGGAGWPQGGRRCSTAARGRQVDRCALRLTRTVPTFDRGDYGDREYSFAGCPVVMTGKGMMDEFITHTCWMRYVPDDASVMTLSIPGTHNSCCVHGLLGLGKAQELDLPDQLNAGIRFLDIRFTHYRDNLCVHHDVICTEKSYVDVLTICFNFLRQHPF